MKNTLGQLQLKMKNKLIILLYIFLLCGCESKTVSLKDVSDEIYNNKSDLIYIVKSVPKEINIVGHSLEYTNWSKKTKYPLGFDLYKDDKWIRSLKSVEYFSEKQIDTINFLMDKNNLSSVFFTEDYVKFNYNPNWTYLKKVYYVSNRSQFIYPNTQYAVIDEDFILTIINR